jgi:hypothetical protein
MSDNKVPILAWLTGRRSDDRRRIHVVMVPDVMSNPARYAALCGEKAGQGAGFVEVDGAETETCPRCRAVMQRQLARHRAEDPHCTCNDCQQFESGR